MARRRRRASADAETLRSRGPFQRQHGPAHEHGQERRPAVGLHPIVGAGETLQAGPRGLSDGRRPARPSALPGDDGRGARTRLERGQSGGDEDGLRDTPAGVWPRSQDGGTARWFVRPGGQRHPRPRQQAGHVARYVTSYVLRVTRRVPPAAPGETRAPRRGTLCCEPSERACASP